jgi:hypothetical protein
MAGYNSAGKEFNPCLSFSSTDTDLLEHVVTDMRCFNSLL